MQTQASGAVAAPAQPTVAAAAMEPSAATIGSLRLLGALATCWYSVNMAAFVLVSVAPIEAVRQRYTPEQLEYLASLPVWSLMISGLSIGFGLVASIAFYFRKAEAYPAYMLSLLLAIGHLFDTVTRGGIGTMNIGDAASTVMILFFTLFLFWASYDAKNHNQLS